MNGLLKTALYVFISFFFILFSVFVWRAGKNTVSIKGAVHFQNISRDIFFYSEDESNEQLRLLRKNEKLDEVVAGAADETEKARRLMNWVAGMKWKNSSANPYPGWNALTVLDWIRSGKTGGHCGQRGIIFGQACQSLGIPVRYVDLSSVDKKGGHFTVEVWSAAQGKWIIMDPTLGAMYMAGGKWLNSREIHSLLVSGRKNEISSEPVLDRKELDESVKGYYYLRYYLRNNFISAPVAIEVADHGSEGKEIVFREERMHWDDKYTSDMAYKSTRRSSKIEDFDWEYRKPEIKATPAFFGIADFYVEVKGGGEYKVKLGKKEIPFTGPGRFRFEWAGEAEVSVTDLSCGCGSVFRLGSLW